MFVVVSFVLVVHNVGTMIYVGVGFCKHRTEAFYWTKLRTPLHSIQRHLAMSFVLGT